ncbi:unnamed protein product [Ixodes pacificus]
MLAGGGAGFCQIIVTTPMELLKIQLQDAGRTGADKRLSARAVATQLIRERGLQGIFSAHSVVPNLSVATAVFATHYRARLARWTPLAHPTVVAHRYTNTRKQGNRSAAHLHTHTLSTDIVHHLSFPKLYHQQSANKKLLVVVFSRILREEGIRAFFKGAGCRVIVIAPLFGIAQTVYFLGVAEFLLGMDR